ncbi:MAG TPA: serine hydrolase domain-containing protein [bacterium]|nr:serine hydrolase domain-containing protein [bacterium]
MRFEKTQAMVTEAISGGSISGASLAVCRSGEMLSELGFGLASREPEREVKPDTIFDAGTLTQPLATVSLIAAISSGKKLNLNTPAMKYWPDFGDEGKEKVSIRHLLKHTSGLAADRPFFKELLETHPDWACTERGKEFVLGKVSSEQLEYPSTYSLIHSEIGYIALGHIAELIGGEPLPALFDMLVAGPLSLSDAGFDLDPARRERCASTGPCPHRNRMLTGEPSDPNAWVMGPGAGHSGLFISASDAARIGAGFASSLAREGGWLSQPIVADFIGPKAKYKMGWETPNREEPACGSKFSDRTIGLVSSTGASLWVDLETEIAIAFFATFLAGTPAWETANVQNFAEILPALHNSIRDEM